MWIVKTKSGLYIDSDCRLTGYEDEAYVHSKKELAVETMHWLEGVHDIDAEVFEYLPKRDTYKEISDIFGEQRRKGIQKYGQEVDESNLHAIQWVDHAREEIADFMVYLTRLRHELLKIDSYKGGD